MRKTAETVPDSEMRRLLGLLPRALQPFASLARFDRPIGWWLLYWPCLWGLFLADGAGEWPLIGWFLAGAVAMRGAGCVYNDIVDRDLDRQVARTRARPLASGAVSVKAAWVWLVLLALVGLVVLLQLSRTAQLVALASLALVAAYPFMKRITWWPQLWLGLVFGWGALVGWFAVAPFSTAILLLYGGAICWIVGYDTVYAIQDIEDDALIGVRSTARRFGDRVQLGVALFYAVAILFWAAAFWSIRPQAVVLLPLVPMAMHLAWQTLSIDRSDASKALILFRSNRFAGFLMALACLVVGATA